MLYFYELLRLCLRSLLDFDTITTTPNTQTIPHHEPSFYTSGDYCINGFLDVIVLTSDRECMSQRGTRELVVLLTKQTRTKKDESDIYYSQYLTLSVQKADCFQKMQAIRFHARNAPIGSTHPYECCLPNVTSHDIYRWGCAYKNSLFGHYEWEKFYSEYVRLAREMHDLKIKKIQCTKCKASGHVWSLCQASRCNRCGSFVYNHDKKNCSV